MSKLQTHLRNALVGLTVFGAFQLSALAGTVQPCVTAASNPGTISVVPILGPLGTQTYCQSAFGWSDTWFATSQPLNYNQHLDVLSGDNAPSFYYTTATGATVGSGNQYNFISPFLDAGTLNATNIGSNWQVISDINVVGSVGTSTIFLPTPSTTDLATAGIYATIVTTVGATGLTEQFTFTNSTGWNIPEMWFDDYFNFHANGSLAGDLGCPTTIYNAGTVTTTGFLGVGCSPIVTNGIMYGSLTPGGPIVLPSTWSVGSAGAVLADIANGLPYNQSLAGFKGDGAADLLWNLGAVADGQSTSFTINKNVTRIPEPATLALLGIGLLGLSLVRRRG